MNEDRKNGPTLFNISKELTLHENCNNNSRRPDIETVWIVEQRIDMEN